MPDHPDLEAEQEFLNRAHDGLDAMRGEARQMLQGVLDLGKGGTFQSRTERDIVVRTSLARLEQLDIGDQALYFGRIDRFAEPDESPAAGAGAPALGESFHIGRLAVSGPDHEPLVVDWRAPVAEPFYRATGLDPQGLARRRHLAVRGRAVLGLEDEYFVDPTRAPGAPVLPVSDAPPSEGDPAGERLLSEGMMLGGPGALLSALGQARTGHMGDIIGTIQREQDEIIRSPLSGVLVVQGGPGTGKTAVALHRAAYLLYTHRFPLERQGVLVVGPNPLFLRYIEQVLPSLGETGVSLSTVAGLVPEVRVRASDDAVVARLKGDVRMVQVLARAVRTRQRPLRRDLDVPFGAGVLRLRARTTEEIVAQARPAARNAQRPPAIRGGPRAPGAGRRLPSPPGPGGRLRSKRAAPASRSRPTWSSACGARRRWRRRWTVCGRGCPLTSCCTICWAPGRCWRPPGRASSAPTRCVVSTGPAAAASKRCRGRWATPPSLTRRAPCSAPGGGVPGRTGRGPAAPRRGVPRKRASGPRDWRPRRCPVRDRARSMRRRPTRTATSWSTRCRTSPPCSCACWGAARCRGR